MFGTALNTSILAANPNKAGLFEGSYFWEGATSHTPLSPTSIIFEEELIQS